MKFLLVDDHPLMRAALSAVVQTLGSEVTVVEAGNAEQARECLQSHADLRAVLLDLRLGSPEGSQEGLGLLREFRLRRPHLPVMVVTGSDDGRDLIRAIDGGAMAYVHKRSASDEIVRALQAILQGGIYLPEDMMSLLDQARAAEATGHPVMSAEPIVTGAPLPPGGGYGLPMPSAQTIARLGLTPRQTDVLMLLLHGKPNKLIARELNLSVETIKDHVAAVLRSLNVTSRTQAVLAVTQLTQGGGYGQNLPRRGLQ